MQSKKIYFWLTAIIFTVTLFDSSAYAQTKQSRKPSNSVRKEIRTIKKRVSAVESGGAERKTLIKRIELKSDLNGRQIEENTTLSKKNLKILTEFDKGRNLNTEGLQIHGRLLDKMNQRIRKQEEISSMNRENTVKIQTAAGLNKNHLNRFWMLLAALLVFFMQAGFKVYEVGLVRMKDRNSVGIKNLLDWMVVALMFYIVGFGFMFGESLHGFIGFSFFAAEGIEESTNELGYEFFLFEIAFAATAATIVSGSLAIRTKLFSYLILALAIGGIIYPLFGHWAWGYKFVPENRPWLAEMGFLDYSGATVVHSVGAWIALVGAFMVRPRLGKFINRETGRISIRNRENFRPYDLGYSVLGLFILWVGWWGFNGGSTVFVTGNETNAFTNTQAPAIILNTSLVGAASGLVAFIHSYFFQHRKNLYEKLMGGTLAGLVAITGCADVVSVSTAVFIVAPVAGILHNLVYDRLNERPVFNRIIDDPIGAIAVHGPAGVWGTICVAFGESEKIRGALGPFYQEGWTRLGQVGDQLLGIVVCFVYTVVCAVMLFGILQKTIGLEVSYEEEAEGDIIGLRDDEKSTNIGLAEVPQIQAQVFGK